MYDELVELKLPMLAIKIIWVVDYIEAQSKIKELRKTEHHGFGRFVGYWRLFVI